MFTFCLTELYSKVSISLEITRHKTASEEPIQFSIPIFQQADITKSINRLHHLLETAKKQDRQIHEDRED